MTASETDMKSLGIIQELNDDEDECVEEIESAKRLPTNLCEIRGVSATAVSEESRHLVANLLDSTTNHWQSDSHTKPHGVTITWPRQVVFDAVIISKKASKEDSYSPERISLYAGSRMLLKDVRAEYKGDEATLSLTAPCQTSSLRLEISSSGINVIVQQIKVRGLAKGQAISIPPLQLATAYIDPFFLARSSNSSPALSKVLVRWTGKPLTYMAAVPEADLAHLVGAFSVSGQHEEHALQSVGQGQYVRYLIDGLRNFRGPRAQHLLQGVAEEMLREPAAVLTAAQDANFVMYLVQELTSSSAMEEKMERDEKKPEEPAEKSNKKSNEKGDAKKEEEKMPENRAAQLLQQLMAVSSEAKLVVGEALIESIRNMTVKAELFPRSLRNILRVTMSHPLPKSEPEEKVKKPIKPHKGHSCVFPHGCGHGEPHARGVQTSREAPRWSCCGQLVSDPTGCGAGPPEPVDTKLKEAEEKEKELRDLREASFQLLMGNSEEVVSKTKDDKEEPRLSPVHSPADLKLAFVVLQMFLVLNRDFSPQDSWQSSKDSVKFVVSMAKTLMEAKAPVYQTLEFLQDLGNPSQLPFFVLGPTDSKIATGREFEQDLRALSWAVMEHFFQVILAACDDIRCAPTPVKAPFPKLLQELGAIVRLLCDKQPLLGDHFLSLFRVRALLSHQLRAAAWARDLKGHGAFVGLVFSRLLKASLREDLLLHVLGLGPLSPCPWLRVSEHQRLVMRPLLALVRGKARADEVKEELKCRILSVLTSLAAPKPLLLSVGTSFPLSQSLNTTELDWSSVAETRCLFSVIARDSKLAVPLRQLWVVILADFFLPTLKRTAQLALSGNISTPDLIELFGVLKKHYHEAELRLVPISVDKESQCIDLTEQAMHRAFGKLQDHENSAISNLLIKGINSLLDTGAEETLPRNQGEALIALLKSLPCGEQFWSIYAQSMAYRLMRRRSRSLELEDQMLQAMPCSLVHGKRAVRLMLSDARQSLLLTSLHRDSCRDRVAQQQYLEALTLSQDELAMPQLNFVSNGSFHVTLIPKASRHWPALETTTLLHVPSELQEAMKDFEGFSLDHPLFVPRVAKRRLEWTLSGSATMLWHGLHGVDVTLEISTVQMFVLLQFNSNKSLSFADLAKQTNAPDAVLKEALLSLVDSRHPILVSDSASSFQEHRFSVNSSIDALKSTPRSQEGTITVHRVVTFTPYEESNLQHQECSLVMAILHIVKRHSAGLSFEELLRKVTAECGPKFEPSASALQQQLARLVELGVVTHGYTGYVYKAATKEEHSQELASVTVDLLPRTKLDRLWAQLVDGGSTSGASPSLKRAYSVSMTSEEHKYVASKKPKGSYVLAPSEVEAKLEAMVRRISQHLGVSLGEALCLLSLNTWDENRCLDTYFEAPSVIRGNAGLRTDCGTRATEPTQTDHLPHFTVIHGGSCPYCGEDNQRGIALWCGHFACINCWRRMLLVKLFEQPCLQTKCINGQCKAAIVPELLLALGFEGNTVWGLWKDAQITNCDILTDVETKTADSFLSPPTEIAGSRPSTSLSSCLPIPVTANAESATGSPGSSISSSSTPNSTAEQLAEVKIHVTEASPKTSENKSDAETSESKSERGSRMSLSPRLPSDAKPLSSPRTKIDMAIEGPRVWKRCLRSCLDDLVNANQKTMSWCRNQHCGYAVVNELDTPSQCPACLSNFCGNCGLVSHVPATCDEIRRWSALGGYMETADTDKDTQRLIFMNSKPCPGRNCTYPIERAEGCLHMTCSRCKHQFCWNCLRPWPDPMCSTGACRRTAEQTRALDSGSPAKSALFVELNRERAQQYLQREIPTGLAKKCREVSQDPAHADLQSAVVTLSGSRRAVAVPMDVFAIIAEASNVISSSRLCLANAAVLSFFHELDKKKAGAQKAKGPTCPNGHSLIRTDEAMSQSCNVCGTDIDGPVFSCRGCDYDRCLSCSLLHQFEFPELEEKGEPTETQEIKQARLDESTAWNLLEFFRSDFEERTKELADILVGKEGLRSFDDCSEQLLLELKTRAAALEVQQRAFLATCEQYRSVAYRLPAGVCDMLETPSSEASMHHSSSDDEDPAVLVEVD